MSSNSAFSKASFDKDLIDKLSPEELDSLLEHLRIIISDERVMKMEAVLAQRTRHVTVVVEDIRKAHNANAILRTAECLGIQDVYSVK
jgi:tRNA (guanosine-2'-O-)-methyltransferase